MLLLRAGEFFFFYARNEFDCFIEYDRLSNSIFFFLSPIRSLPISALDEDEDDEGEYDSKDDEKNGVQYNYTFFHLVFALAAMYIAMVLTNWNTFDKADGASDNLILIGQSWPAVWVKVVSSWICYGLYGFSLLAPVLFPERFMEY